ncbi:MAG: hypothetical protein KDE27_14670, partial [Planctomycetes bacterium]|nr:hypothetical protein [Planctomycetota bacterium]
TAPELVSNGVTACADTMLAFGVLAAAIAWLRWQASGAQVWWRLFCFALAAVVATKNEGLMLALVLLLAAGAQQLLA